MPTAEAVIFHPLAFPIRNSKRQKIFPKPSATNRSRITSNVLENVYQPRNVQKLRTSRNTFQKWTGITTRIAISMSTKSSNLRIFFLIEMIRSFEREIEQWLRQRRQQRRLRQRRQRLRSQLARPQRRSGQLNELATALLPVGHWERGGQSKAESRTNLRPVAARCAAGLLIC
jgi:predicted RNase H-like nuclease (RuvC/YqgF family)